MVIRWRGVGFLLAFIALLFAFLLVLLFDSNGFGEIFGLVDVGAEASGGVVSEQLDGDGVKNGVGEVVGIRHGEGVLWFIFFDGALIADEDDGASSRGDFCHVGEGFDLYV